MQATFTDASRTLLERFEDIRRPGRLLLQNVSFPLADDPSAPGVTIWTRGPFFLHLSVQNKLFLIWSFLSAFERRSVHSPNDDLTTVANSQIILFLLTYQRKKDARSERDTSP